MLNRDTFIRNEQQRAAFLDWFKRVDPYTRMKELTRLAGWKGALELSDWAMSVCERKEQAILTK